MDEAVFKRIPPHNDEAERAVIGSMMMDQDAVQIASEQLQGEDFYNGQYGVIFSALVEMHQQGVGTDLVTIQNKLREMEIPPELTSVEYIGDLINSVPTSANIRYYVKIVQEKSVLRSLIKVTESITGNCYLDKNPLEDILEDAEKKVYDVVQRRNSGEFENIRDVVLRTLDSIETAAKQQGHITGLQTGFRDLDYKTAGLQPSDLILIAARPAMGKTAFVLNLAEYIALHSQSTIAMFSLEMSKEQLVKRMLSMNSKVDSQHIRTGKLQDDEWSKITESSIILGESALVIDDTPAISINELRNKCRKIKMERGLSLIIIDYLQLMSGNSGSKNISRQQEISDISRSLKALARELNCPVIALSQLSRQVESRDNKRPILSDLRESGAIEQDADVVMFLYRDEYYEKDASTKKGITEIIIGKQRNGPTCTVELKWLGQYTKFANLEYQTQD